MTDIPLDLLVRWARISGFAWSDAELEPLRPAIERAFETLARLERLPLGAVEPTTMYRVL